MAAIDGILNFEEQFRLWVQSALDRRDVLMSISINVTTGETSTDTSVQEAEARLLTTRFRVEEDATLKPGSWRLDCKNQDEPVAYLSSHLRARVTAE